MHALVTGGSGFIGSNVVKRLLQDNVECTVFDNLSSGHYSNIERLVRTGEVEFIQGDICDAQKIDKVLREKHFDVVFHLAASVGRQRSLDNPVLDSTTNLIGTVNVLEAMRKTEVPRIVYSSSAAIFGELICESIDENHPQNADSPYGVSKLAAEKMILAYCGIYPITGVCLRYFNIYGVNQRYDSYGNVIPIFAKRIYAGEPLFIYGDGEQTRDFLNVSDVAEANYRGMKFGDHTEVYNLGCGKVITINRLAEMMLDITGRSNPIIHAPERPADVRHCKAKTERVFDELGFKASVEFETGLEEYLKWYRDNCVKE